MRVAIYARISTHLGQNPDLQLDALKEIAKNKGWEVIGEYVDVISGSKSSKQRPQLNNLMNDAFQRRFDCVMVYALDRLARSIEHFINITNELTALNINLFSMRESIDLSTPTGRAFASMVSVIAQLEREITSERVSLGVRSAIKRKGTWGGRKTNLTPQVKNKVIELRDKGVGIRKIATQLKIGVGTTYDIIKTERKVA
tara:strand:- start:122 stop:721 length:600 start_codon:yes stop_codon:yes gene_type:complete